MNILTQNYLTRGFWGDEAWTGLISQFSLPEIVRITGEDFHPPFYYFLVHFWIRLFGANEWIRLLSVIFWLATPVIVYKIAKKLNPKIAGLAALLTLANPILFTYAFEARNYALLYFLISGSVLAWLKKKWLVFLALGIVGVYTHYYFWLVLAAIGIYWLIADRKDFKKIFLSFGAIVAAQLPWLPTLFSQVKTVAGDYWIGAIDKRTHWEWFYRTAAGDMDVRQRMVTAWLILILLILALARKKGSLLLWLWLIVPVAIPSLVSLYRPVFFYRYLIFTAIPMMIIIMQGLRSIHKLAMWGGAGLILALYLSINSLSFARYPNSMREELKDYKEKQIATVLPKFAEVMFYKPKGTMVIVKDEGLVQYSGKSLLDAYVRKGEVMIK